MNDFSRLLDANCPRCNRVYAIDAPLNVCQCGSPLTARYDLEAVKQLVSPGAIESRPPTLWRYHELLPVTERCNVTSLGEGMTPLLHLDRLGVELGVGSLCMKDDGLLPTGTFKARGAAVGISRARELAIERVAMPTNGNAGAAWALYAARAGISSLIVMPADAPEVTRRECVAAGAETIVVDGLIGDAAVVVRAVVASEGWFDVSTLREPYRLEGKKTLGFEIAEQLGWRMPDVVVYPTGGGVGLIGIAKAFREMKQLGWIEGELPRFVAVQAEGCAPIVRAFENGETRASPWADASTIAFGITVPAPLGDELILTTLYETGGTAVSVSDREAVQDQLRCAQAEGIFLCPEGGAAVAAVRVLRANGWIRARDKVVVVNTGSGLKYPDLFVDRSTRGPSQDELQDWIASRHTTSGRRVHISPGAGRETPG